MSEQPQELQPSADEPEIRHETSAALGELSPRLPDGSEEPPLAEEDTRPKAPLGLREPVFVEWSGHEPPVDPLLDTAPRPVAQPVRPRTPVLLIGLVLGCTLCICVMMAGLAGYAGYRDGLATNDARVTQTLATGIAEQYTAGVADLQSERYELAIDRFSWIVKTIQPAPDYLRDSPELLAKASTLNAYTSTPTPSQTPTPTLTPTPTQLPTAEASGTPSGPDSATLYDQAYNAMLVNDLEGAIEWLDSLTALDPAYRTQEVQAMYLEALTVLGRTYLRGQNEDGEDMLARGVLLIYRADDIGDVEPPDLLYEADFAERYLNARSYVNGGNYDAALPVLERLCEESCDWAYHGVSVRDLLERARTQQ